MVSVPVVKAREWQDFLNALREFSDNVQSEDPSVLSGMQLYGYHCWWSSIDHQLREFFRRSVELETGFQVVDD